MDKSVGVCNGFMRNATVFMLGIDAVLTFRGVIDSATIY